MSFGSRRFRYSSGHSQRLVKRTLPLTVVLNERSTDQGDHFAKRRESANVFAYEPDQFSLRRKIIRRFDLQFLHV